MKKSLKKTLGVLLSLAMAAGTVVLPTAASAADPVTIAKDGYNLKVTSTQNAVAIVASYNDDDTLKSVATTALTANAEKIVYAKNGDKVMVWDSLAGMKPLLEAPYIFDNSTNITKYDFGDTANTAAGYTGVAADTKYTSAQGYGLLGLENGFALDSREDGWVMTQGFDLVLTNGAENTVADADDDWVATTTRQEGGQDYNSPIRFSKKVSANTYYRVKVALRRADTAKEAKVSLFTEKRHQHLLDEPIPEEGLVYETNVYVHNNWSKNTKEYVDTQLSITASGDNVAVSSIEIEQTSQGKTFWILGDSTVCQQTASIPYFPLDHCQGVGSAMPKYISGDWALVNEAESGLDAASAKNHFGNMKSDIKEGDVVWFEFGHNDDKVSNDPSTNGYLTNLASYYSDISTAKANLIIASPVERDQASQFSNGTWNYTLSHYTTAASNFVNEKIAEGKTNIAFINLNTRSLEFLNKVQKDIDKVRADEGLESLEAATTRFYYYVSKYSGYKQDYTHPNDYGADNFAYLAMDEAKKTIAAANEADATDNTKKQAAVLSLIFGDDTRNYEPATVADEIVLDGAPTNSYYPNQLAKVVLYEKPIIVDKVDFDDTAKTPAQMNVSLVASDVQYSYGRGVIDIYDSNGAKRGTVKTTDVVDAVSAETQTLTFAESNIAFDAAAGDTFNAYVIKIEQNPEGSGYVDLEDIISTTYTQNDMIDVKEYLLQGALGTENKEDFSTYDLTEGESIIGKGDWTNPGGQKFVYGEDADGTTYAHCETDGSGTFYPEKKFTAQKTGQLYCRMDVRYISGEFNLYFTDGSILNTWPTGRIMPVQIKTSDSEVKVFLNGTAKASINANAWTTFALTIDFDYGKYYLSINGTTYEEDFSPYNTTLTPLTPSNLSLIAFQNGNSTNEYDVTNIVLATLNTAALPDKTLTVQTTDAEKGSVSIKNGDETVSGTTLTTAMNTVVTAVAEPASGFALDYWEDSEGNAISYSPVYEIRLHSDITAKAVFKTKVVDPLEGKYLFNEDFTTLTTSSLSANGWTCNDQSKISVVQNESYADFGNYLEANGASGSKGAEKVFDTTGFKDESGVIYEMDAKFIKGGTDTNEIALHSGRLAQLSNQYNWGADSSTVIINLVQAKDASSTTVNGTATTTVIPNDTWFHLYVKFDFTGHKMDIKITSLDGATTYYNASDLAVSEADTCLKGLYYRVGRTTGKIDIDNIKIYPASAVTPAS